MGSGNRAQESLMVAQGQGLEVVLGGAWGGNRQNVGKNSFLSDQKNTKV